MNHKKRIEAIEKKSGAAAEGISTVIRYIHSETGELLREDITRTPGHTRKSAVVIADQNDMEL